MDTVSDFEDILSLFATHKVRYMIIGGMAFIFHAKPRFTKDMDLWVDPAGDNVLRANRALAEFGSPELLDEANPTEILQLGVAPNRIDILRSIPGADFNVAWEHRLESRYGSSPAIFVGLDTLIQIKSAIPDPRHQDDARVLRAVKKLQSSRK
jgi:hypothetical protein